VGRLDGLTVVVGAPRAWSARGQGRVERVLNGTVWTLRASGAKADGRSPPRPRPADAKAPGKKGQAPKPEPEAEAEPGSSAGPGRARRGRRWPSPSPRRRPRSGETPEKPKTDEAHEAAQAQPAVAAAAGNGQVCSRMDERPTERAARRDPSADPTRPRGGRPRRRSRGAQADNGDGAEQLKPKKKTRRGSRGGRNRRRKPAAKGPRRRPSSRSPLNWRPRGSAGPRFDAMSYRSSHWVASSTASAKASACSSTAWRWRRQDLPPGRAVLGGDGTFELAPKAQVTAWSSDRRWGRRFGSSKPKMATSATPASAPSSRRSDRVDRSLESRGEKGRRPGGAGGEAGSPDNFHGGTRTSRW
jgi:hypothetical protein